MLPRGTNFTAAASQLALALDTPDDRLVIVGRELHWLPIGRLSDSQLDIRKVGKAVGPIRIRTRRTIDRIAAKYLSG